MKTIAWQDFEQVELRVGTILEVAEFPEAKKPAYRIKVDFGAEIGVKRASAQITSLYERQELIGKQIIGVTNFAPKQIGPFLSEVLITGFIRDDGAVVLAVPDKKVENGLKLA